MNLSPLAVADVLFPLARMFTCSAPKSAEVKSAAGGLRALWRAADPIDRSHFALVCSRRLRARGQCNAIADAVLWRERNRAQQQRGPK